MKVIYYSQSQNRHQTVSAHWGLTVRHGLALYFGYRANGRDDSIPATWEIAAC